MGYRWILHAATAGLVILAGLLVMSTLSAEARPEAQDDFVDLVSAASTQVGDTDNDLAIDRALEERAASLCALLGADLKVERWVGKVEDVSSSLLGLGDDGVLTIAVSEIVAVKTNRDTNIESGSDLHETLVDLREGDRVHFSGTFIADPQHCIRETSLLNENSLATPDFGFEFASVDTME